MKVLGVIPARYASTRFPAKPLADLAGKAMIEWVYGQAKKCTGLARVVVATDHEKIFDHLQNAGADVCMTGQHHLSGTDRCFEALQQQHEKYDGVVNIQGDEPFIDPAQINLVIELLASGAALATLVKKIEKHEHLNNPNVVKAVVAANGYALYFSRSPVPHVRMKEMGEWLRYQVFFKHIGMYGYRAEVLAEITALAPSPLETSESLEQLRWLENGYRIKVAETQLETLGIDTPEDLEAARMHLVKNT
jgi:3-deoxy-manno-octulosonate cytidylyltransferase (CMP-KDO synthetase)